jgi:hypothetical protein
MSTRPTRAAAAVVMLRAPLLALALLVPVVMLVSRIEAGPAAKTQAARQAPSDDDCLACHSDKDLKRSAPRAGRGSSVFVDPAALKGSTHAGLDCVSCHTTATAPHDEKLPPVRCAECHGDVPPTLAQGAHGGGRPGGRSAPTCAACHGTHDVRPATAQTIDTCGQCHGRQVGEYRQSVHGRARSGKEGGAEAATCASCHGSAHALLRKDHPQAPTYHLNLPRTCAGCHANPELAKRHNIRVSNAYQLYMDSIHGRALSRSGLLVAANCSDCHGAHDIKERTEPTSRVNAANIPKTCGTCHAGVERTYVESVHGRAVAAGNKNAPVCSDCHSAHQIQRVEAEPWQLDVIRECGTCHEESLRTYRDTFHGKVTQLGFARVAKCADCHGSHAILPAANPASMVSATNIVATCRQCHPAANFAFTRFQPHADPHDRERYPLLYWPYVGMTGILVVTFAFFGIHTLLWLPRSLAERLRHRRRPPAGEPSRGAAGEESAR